MIHTPLLPRHIAIAEAYLIHGSIEAIMDDFQERASHPKASVQDKALGKLTKGQISNVLKLSTVKEHISKIHDDYMRSLRKVAMRKFLRGANDIADDIEARNWGVASKFVLALEEMDAISATPNEIIIKIETSEKEE